MFKEEKITIGTVIITIIITVLIIIAGMFCITLDYQNNEKMVITVQEKVVKNADKTSKYLVFTDKGVYEIKDLLFKGKFNSSDIYSSLQIGQTYKIESTGYRVGFFTMYKNINKVEVLRKE